MDSKSITFESLPHLTGEILSRLDSIEGLLLKSISKAPTDQWFTPIGLCQYIPGGMALSTLYALTAKKKIPHHKDGKKLRFLKSEIDKWLHAGKVNTLEEVRQEADAFLTRKK